jgi:hypothetical protein
MTNATFTSMDVSTKEEWLNIGAETAKNQPRVAEGILNMLRGMDSIVDGFVTDQLTHALQTATMAERAGRIVVSRHWQGHQRAQSSSDCCGHLEAVCASRSALHD